MATETKKIINRRDTAARWESANPILANGEIGIDITNNEMKVGDGKTAWKGLPPVSDRRVIDSLMCKKVVGGTTPIQPTSEEIGILYKTDGSVVSSSYNSYRYAVPVGTVLKATISSYYGSAGYVHLAYVTSSGDVVVLVDSQRPVNTEFYLTATDEIKEFIVSGCDVEVINDDVVLQDDISVSMGGVYGSSFDGGTIVTANQMWAVGNALEHAGVITAVKIREEGISSADFTVLICKSSGDNLVVSTYHKVNVSTGVNPLLTPIRFDKGDYIGFFSQTVLARWSSLATNVAPAYFASQGTAPAVGSMLKKSDKLLLNFSIEYELTYSVNFREAFEQLLNPSPLRGKSVLFIGDSITDTGHYINSIKEKTGCTAYNRGWSGTTLAVTSGRTNSMCERLELPANDSVSAKYQGFPTKVDYVFLLGGINDWGQIRSQVFGSLTDAIDNTTFCGALKYMLRGLKLRYPSAKIVVLNLLHTYSPDKFPAWSELSYADNDETKAVTVALNSVGKSLYDYREAISGAAKMYGVPVIDLFEVGFTATLDADRAAYYTDGLHPNEAGGEKMAAYILSQLDKL